jgi:hypothetical protein
MRICMEKHHIEIHYTRIYMEEHHNRQSHLWFPIKEGQMEKHRAENHYLAYSEQHHIEVVYYLRICMEKHYNSLRGL